MSHWSTASKLAIGAVGGGATALIVGWIWIAIAPDNGFADLGAAAVTRVVLAPLGVVLGVAAAGLARRRAFKA